MEAVVGLLLMLLRVFHGVETCDGRLNGTWCYGALGGSVVIQLVDNESEIFRLTWSTNTTTLLFVNEGHVTSNAIAERSVFTVSKGTFQINNLGRNDAGQYKSEIFSSNGRRLSFLTLQLIIQAPVSSVWLVFECLSQGEMMVTCSPDSEDSPRYSWTLDGDTLTDAHLISGNNHTKEITLKQNISGCLVCSVRNNVSEAKKQKNLSTCGFIFINCTLSNGTQVTQWVYEANNTLCNEPTTTTTSPTTNSEGKENPVSNKPSFNITTSSPNSTSTAAPWYRLDSTSLAITMTGVVVGLLLIVVLAWIYLQKKKQGNQSKEEADEQELTYAEVRVVQQPPRRVQQRAEEVEYGHVKFSEPPRQNAGPMGSECVYAHVHAGR